MQAYRIVSATISDIPTIIKLAEAIWHPTYAKILSEDQIVYMFDHIYNETSLRKQIEQEGHQFLILYLNNEPVGFAAYSETGEHIFKLHKLYVLQAFHGKGLGKVLIQQVEQVARRLSGCILELNVNRNNPAKDFYEKLGFTVYQEADIPIGPFWMNDYVMRKHIQEK